MPQRVLMTADAVGGVWHYAIELAGSLTRSDVEVVLAVLGPPPVPDQVATATTIDGLTLVHGEFTLEWMPGAEGDLNDAGAWLLELEHAFRPDLVHLNGFAHAALPWRAPTLVAAHSCVLSWWRAVKGADAPAEWAAYRQWTLAGLRAADLVVAPTRAFLGQVQALYGPLDRALWIWNGRAVAGRPGADKEPLIFAAGRVWDEAKNLGALAAIAHRLPWPLAIAGPGAPRRANGHAKPGAALWLGPLPAEAMQQWYARASVFALPSRYEPFGLAALDAGLAGCALVLGDIPTLRELWDGAALFVPPDDGEALASALNALVDNPELLWLLGGLARSRAEGYSAARMTAEYLDAYAGVLATRARAAPALACARGSA
jgi:glycosyltransferase involved in cell wall biosynthesis